MVNTPSLEDNSSSWLDKTVFPFFPKFKIEHLLITILMILAIISRFYNVGARDMSHDEVNHVVPSYELYQGQGYQHNPITHGPLQFHLIAATYFLFGDSDTASRIPSAVFSIMTIAFVALAFKRYLGRAGSILAGYFYLISPYMLFYGRYTRNESFVAFFGVVMLFTVLNYLETGKKADLLILSAAVSFQYCVKETSYIYTAILLLFLGVIFLKDVIQNPWKNKLTKDVFSFSMIFAIFLAGLAMIASTMEAKASSTTQPFTSTFLQGLLPVYHTVLLISLGLTAIVVVVGLVSLFKGLGWKFVKQIRSFDLLILTFTLILPLLTAFPVKLLGWDPLDYSQSALIHTLIVLVIMALIAIFIGMAWKPTIWAACAGLFYAIFTVFYTTFFTNGQGFFTGIVGSLGYWLSQQSVNRGTQPWYYYSFLQIPMYEYLAALGLVLAVVYALRHRLFSTLPGISPSQQPVQIEQDSALLTDPAESGTNDVVEPEESAQNSTMPSDETVSDFAEPDEIVEVVPIQNKRIPVLSLLTFWSMLSLIAYSIAGEKMPWLTVHITLPMLLAAGWSVGYLLETIPWKKLKDQKGLFAVLLVPVFLVSFLVAVSSFFGQTKPFAGMNLDQLQATSTFLFSALACILSAWGILEFLKDWNGKDLFRLTLAGFFLILSVLTARSAYQANYINFDNAKEFLVYAHGAAGAKQIYTQVEEISTRITGGKNIKVAYLGDALYPYWWYFRDYPNKMWYKDQLTKDLLNYPLVICDDTLLTKAQSILGDNYVQYDYKRLWWPMMDYTNLTFDRVKSVFTKPGMLEAIFDIWFNKDYTLYASLTNNQNLTLETWQPSAGLHFFISKDIVNKIWDYGTTTSTATTTKVDPYANNYVTLTPDKFFGQVGTDQGQFTNAHGIAYAPNGTLYITDSGNNRIEHFSVDGKFLGSWGVKGSVDAGNAPGGSFNEPWGIAVGPDGSVYVADTWNYRIQKFTADGNFVTMWGTAGQAESPTAFWGPRGVAVDQAGNVYVTDTGNKRVVEFDSGGNYITEFGSYGMDNGQFDEPVGIAVDKSGNVYVADTWNNRIQVFAPDTTGKGFTFLRAWTVDAWDNQSTENKPFIAVDGTGNVYVTDPSGFRVLEFTNEGQIVRAWGSYSSGIDGFGNPVGLALDAEERLWVMDSVNGYALRFTAAGNSDTSTSDIPAIPTSQVTLTYDSASNQLVDSQKNAYYQLDATRKIWIPLIPESVVQSFSQKLTAFQDADGNWQLKTNDGTTVYTWNAESLTWQLLPPTQPTATK